MWITPYQEIVPVGTNNLSNAVEIGNSLGCMNTS